MTPQEKAAELFKRFYCFPNNSKRKIGYIQFKTARQCALIVVDEIIQSRQDDGHFDDALSSTGSEYYTPHPMYLTYWLQVKQEIENIS